MATVVGFGTRENERVLPTFNFVGAYAPSAWDILHANIPQQQGIEYISNETLLYEGWNSPDLISYDSNSSDTPYGTKNGMLGAPRMELVGVQPHALKIKRFANNALNTISGNQLAEYIEKIEYRYLQDGHVRIKVYIIESASANLNDNDLLIFEGNILLQGGREDLGVLVKKAVPFSINAPHQNKAGSFTQNPTIDVAQFLTPTSGGDKNIGMRVRVQDLGDTTLADSGNIQWNSVRTHTFWENYASLSRPNPGRGTATQRTDIPTLEGPGLNDHFLRQPAYSPISSSPSFRKLDISRDPYDKVDPRNGATTAWNNSNLHGGSHPDSFSLLQMHCMNSGSPAFGSLDMQPWGVYAGIFTVGPTYQDPKYGGTGGTTLPPGWFGGDHLPTTTVLGGDNLGYDALGYVELASVESSHCGTFQVQPGTAKYRNPYYPHAGSQFIHYVTFFAWQGSGFNILQQQNYVPPISELTDSVIGSVDAQQWAYYCAFVFHNSVTNFGTTGEEQTIDDINNAALNNWFGETKFETTATHVSWQDYISGAFYATADPDNLGPFNFNGVVGTEGQDLIPGYHKVFGGLYHANGTSNQVQCQARTSGFNTIGGTAGRPADDVLNTGITETTDTELKSLSLGRMFAYTVFVYADAPLDRNEQVAPWNDSTQVAQQYDNPFTSNPSAINLNHTKTFGLQRNGNDFSLGFLFDWSNGSVSTTKCLDRNSRIFYENYLGVDDTTQWKLGNISQCAVAGDYTRCGCESEVESTGSGELNDSIAPGDASRFEAIVVYPRNIVNFEFTGTDTGGADAYPSLLYINSYYSVLNDSATPDTSYANLYLTNTTAGGGVSFKTNEGAFQTILLSALVGTGNNYDGIFQAALLPNNSTDSNTFSYSYFPGREPFEAAGGEQYFVHDEASEARIYATVGGSGFDSATQGDDFSHRQILMFAAENLQTAGTSPKRAHIDLGWSQSWEDEDVECSHLHLGAPNCIAADKDPEYRIRKFVVVGDPNIDLGFEDEDGDGHDDNRKEGCTDPAAINYDPNATVDDGSCIFCEDVLDQSTYTEGQTFAYQAIPYLFNNTPGVPDGLGTGTNIGIVGTAPHTAIGDVSLPQFDIPAAGAPGSGEIYPWQDGNLFNAVNTAGQALISGASNGPNTAFSYFRFEQSNLLHRVAYAASSGSQQQTGTADLALEYEEALTQAINGEDASSWSMHIFNYSDWEARTIPASQVGNGWAVESDGGGITTLQSNVYADDLGDFTGIALAGVEPVSTLPNLVTGVANKVAFRNYNSANPTETVIDIGLKAGYQYVAVLRFHPKNQCGTKFYYFAYNFWVEYCECTDPTSESFGNYAEATDVPYINAPWMGESIYPGVNTPNDQVNLENIASPGTGLPQNFCANNGGTGLINSRICKVTEDDTTVTCDEFMSWCLTETTVDCIGPDETGNMYGETSFEILIDGFFVQSTVDQYQLIDPETGFQFAYEINVGQDGEFVGESIPSHIEDPNNPGFLILNPLIQINETQTGESQGATATISQGPFVFDDTDGDGVTDDTTITVFITFIGFINTEGQIIYGTPDYVVSNTGETANGCPAQELSYIATARDCIDPVYGCMDETAINFNENATVDDGSCEYIPCEEIFNEALNAIFITRVEDTDASLLCISYEAEEEGADDYVVWTPQYDGTMAVTIEDYSASTESGALGNNTGNFSLFVGYMGGGNVNFVGDALSFYNLDNNAETIQNLQDGQFLSLPDLPGAYIGTQSITGSPITNGDPFFDGSSLSGTSYTITIPTGAIFGENNDLTGGQYILFVVPHIDVTSLGEGFGGLDDCINEFGTFADEQTFHVIDQTATGDCPQPCNQFVDPENCPNNIAGCTDESADNYDETATIDDGSCEYCTTCDFCDLYPTHPDCTPCEKRPDTGLGVGSRGFTANLRDCDPGPKCCADQTATNYDPDCQAEDEDNSSCTYACTGAGCIDCEDDPTGEDCIEDPCPDPNNPLCVDPPVVPCLQEGDCPCVGNGCNPECLLNPEECEPGTPPCEQSVQNNECNPIETFTTTTIICNPVFNNPELNGSIDSNWIASTLMQCTSDETKKMLFKMKTGVKIEDTDLRKLGLIAYLFVEGAKNNLECLFDCDNYESAVTRTGKVRGFANRVKETDCNAKWKSGRFQRFAASSHYKKGTAVKYTRVVNGRLVSSIYTAKRDWYPGMEIPGNKTRRQDRVWEPCVNFKFQAGGNPENYFQTFLDFINRFCNACNIENPSTVYTSNEDANPIENRDTFGENTIGFIDDDGNEIIF